MTKFSYRSFFLGLALVAMASAASAQQSLSLREATGRALERQYDIRIERLRVEAADAEIQRTHGEYDVQLQLDLGARHLRTPNTSLFSGAPVGDVAATENSLFSQVSLTKLLTSGAVGSVFASTGRDTSDGLLTLLSPAYTSSVGVELRQPLLQRRAIDPTRMALRLTALDRDRSGARLDRQVLDVVADVEQAYWTLVAARREVVVRQASVTLAERQRDDTAVRIEAKTLAASDIAQPRAEIERRRGDLISAQERLARAERALKSLILDDPADALWTVEIQPTDAPEGAVVAIDAMRALGDAQTARPELSEIAAEIAQGDVRVTAARDALKPTLDVYGSYVARGLSGRQSENALAVPGFNTMVPAPLEGSVPTSWRTLVDQRFPDVSVGVTFGIPIGRRAAKGQLGGALATRREADVRKAQLQTRIATEVRNAITAVEAAANRIAAASAGLAAAETQLRAEEERFSAGVGTNFFVLTRQSELATAQLAHLGAITDHRVALAELGRATGTLTRDRGIVLEHK